MILDLYLQSAGVVSPIGTDTSAVFFGSEKPMLDNGKARVREPVYTGLIPAMQLRRMSKSVRTGVAAAKAALSAAGLEKPDAVSVGTALGCLHDTEAFLGKMIEQEEQMLSPTAFIQSTHNTVSGAIALQTGCSGHNNTFAQRGHSFEHALIDAALQLSIAPGNAVLVGGIDELTETSYALMCRAGVYGETAMAGEGASFVVVRKEVQQGIGGVRLHALKMLFAGGEAVNHLADFIAEFSFGNSALLLQGVNGDTRADNLYEALRMKALPHAEVVSFKQWCGDYPTAASFALAAVADAAVKRQINPGKVAIVNHWLDAVSCYLLEVI